MKIFLIVAAAVTTVIASDAVCSSFIIYFVCSVVCYVAVHTNFYLMLLFGISTNFWLPFSFI